MEGTFYEQLCKDDWVQYFKEQFDNLEIRFDSEGKFKAFKRLTPELPWLHTKASQEQMIHGKCAIYQYYFAQKIGFIHSICHDCYKVVVAPRTVKELFQLYDYQQEINIPGKCGIEKRPFVPRLYGGYFYNRGLEAGKRCYRRVSEDIGKRISPDINIILKRGCSEFEMKYGSSDKWKILPKQKEWEDKFDTLFVEDSKTPLVEPDYLVAHIKREWLHFAAKAKPPDMTYLEFTGGVTLTQTCKYVTYHKEPSLIKVVR